MPDKHFQLKVASLNDCLALRHYFINLSEVTRWGGEGFSFPLQKHAFLQKLLLPDTQSFVLFRGEQAVGFGQICDRFGRHHLARLLVFPKFRRQGLSQILLQGLMLQAIAQNKRLDFSLYVFLTNETAINSYLKVGFSPASQPGQVRDDLAFMTLSAEQAQLYLKHHSIGVNRQPQALSYARVN